MGGIELASDEFSNVEDSDFSRGCCAWIFILIGLAYLGWVSYQKSIATASISWPTTEASWIPRTPSRTQVYDRDSKGRTEVSGYEYEVWVIVRYQVGGKTYENSVGRRFDSESEAEEFVKSTKGKRGTVRYNPSDPSQTNLSHDYVGQGTGSVIAWLFLIPGLCLLLFVRSHGGQLYFIWSKEYRRKRKGSALSPPR